MLDTIMTISNATICATLALGAMTAVGAELRTYRARKPARATFTQLCGSTTLNSMLAGLGL
jgi:hypothetical protein